MKLRSLGISTALAAGVAAAGLTFAPVAGAVAPESATIGFDCGSFGSGTATLTATQDGTSATIDIATDAVKAPFDVPAGSASSTLTLTRNGSDSVTFTGKSNPDIPAGSGVDSGPLTGTVAAGDSLEAKTLKVTVIGITATCNATTAQDPGPFVF
ncbi:hypothetical protein [Streptomyces sp. TS71-3]|uniref:hypothetical protein n=1 Tax=Streptomyces sp. TS71-3 TaxID=2733862 RepID=UPI001B1331EE|nr:hypothetical protein [Streptomyces sp. TS71-3]GHJ39286.1 hypothetical protein Sm713_48950 [Streptomyces sp. TS71-3]